MLATTNSVHTVLKVLANATGQEKAIKAVRLGRVRDVLTGQWLGLGAFTNGAQVQSLVAELRFHKPDAAAKRHTHTCI